MKNTLIPILAMLMFSGLLFAQIDLGRDLNLLMPQPSVQSDVYFGIFVEDLTFPKAQELGYDYLYGILITQVVEDSPAWMSGMRANDIIMELNGDQVADKADFDTIRAALKPGQMVKIRLWSNGMTKDLEMEMQARKSSGVSKEVELSQKTEQGEKKLSAGYGGGSWVPYWVMPEVDDVNHVMNSLGFGTDPIDDAGQFMNGGAGKLHVGKGIFIGGQGAVYDYVEDLPGGRTSIRYSSTFAGATIDKRIPFSRSLIGSVGVMIGGGGHEINYSSTADVIDWDDLGSVNSKNFVIKKEYFTVQPRAELMFRLLKWLGIRAEVGYLYGLPTYKGWYLSDNNDQNFKITDSPNTKFQSLTFSVGPWFGF